MSTIIAPTPPDPWWGSGSPPPAGELPAPRPPRQFKVNSARHSRCAVPLSELDWSYWWVGRDRKTDEFFLLVLHATEPTMVKLTCRWENTVGVAMREGELYWLVGRGSR